MRIGERSRRTSLSRDTIRFYERSGLIRSAPGPDRTNRYRDDPEDTELSPQLIREARGAGMSIDDVRRFMTQLEALPGDGFDGEAFLDRKIGEVEGNIRRSKRFLLTLRATRKALSGGS